MKIEEFKTEIKKLNINSSNEKDLEIYFEFLREYNKHTNLTSIIEKEDVYLKHFYDSLTITKTIDFSKVKTLIDIGSGAGFPGMIIKIFFPEIEVTLLDSNGKKTKFLSELSSKLNIKEGLNIINKRSEDYCRENREKFDVVTSRGVADLKVLSELSIPFLKFGGHFLPLKGNIEEELNSSLPAITILGGEVKKVLKFKLPNENSARTIPVIQKINKTANKYPRNYSAIIKKPLI